MCAKTHKLLLFVTLSTSAVYLSVFPVMILAREVEAKNFVLNIGHLGRREPVVQPTTLTQGGCTYEAHDDINGRSSIDGDDVGGISRPGVR